MKLLTTENHKTVKGEKIGYKTYILYMSPFTDNSKGINMCSHATPGCSSVCLFGSGFGGMFDTVKTARRNKTEYFLSDRSSFLKQLDKEIGLAVKKNEGKFKLAIRLNGTSDIRWEKFKIRDGKTIFELYPKVKFYDYTKNHFRFGPFFPNNYTLVFSRSESNEIHMRILLARGYNVSVVFDEVPKKYLGYRVIDGDKTDLRFRDPKGVIVGLKYKKMTSPGAGILNSNAMKSGFVVITKKQLKIAA